MKTNAKAKKATGELFPATTPEPEIAGIIVPTMEAIDHLEPSQKVDLFRKAEEAGRASFLTRGKIYASLADKARDTLISAGISAGSVSNAAYAAKTFAVADGKRKIHLQGKLTKFDEGAYDRLTFNQCVVLSRATSTGVKGGIHQPSEARLTAILQNKGWEDELELYFADGLTNSERKAVESLSQLEADKQAQAAASAITTPEAASTGIHAPEVPRETPQTPPNVVTFQQPAADNEETEDEGSPAPPAAVPAPAPTPSTPTPPPAGTPAPSPYKPPVEITVADAMSTLDELEEQLCDINEEDDVLQIISRMESLLESIRDRVAA